jgi:PhnB protein
MPSTVKPIPDEYRGATPYLCVHDAASAIDFYRHAFGAIELMRMSEPQGKIGHAELQIGNAHIMLSDEYPDIGVRCPQGTTSSPVSILLYVEDADSVVKQAVASGAKVLIPLGDRFYGDRTAKIQDPYGHTWLIATHKEDVPPDEMHKRAQAQFGAI